MIHADLCESTETPSLQGEMYFMLFIDDYTIMMWEFFIIFKPETLECFKTFKATFENESESKIK